MTEQRSRLIKLLLVDDHTLFRESLRRLLEGEDGIEVVGDYSSAEGVLSAIRAGVKFDAALLDYDLGLPGAIGSSGLDLVRQVRGLVPHAHILMLTAGMDTSLLRQAIGQLGVGIFLKTEPTGELLIAIHKTVRGEQWISSRASLALLAEQTAQKADPDEMGTLTDRESRVLRAVLEGQTNKEIGARLSLTESAVKAVLQKLFEKAGVRSRSQLVRYAIETRGLRSE